MGTESASTQDGTSEFSLGVTHPTNEGGDKLRREPGLRNLARIANGQDEYAKPSEQTAAARLLLERAYGKPEQEKSSPRRWCNSSTA